MLFDLAQAIFVALLAEWIISGLFNDGAAGVGDDAGGAEMVSVIIANAERGIRNIQRNSRCGLDIERLTGRKGRRQVGDKREVAIQLLVPLIGFGVIEPSRERRREARSPSLESGAGNISASGLDLLRRRIGVGADNSDCSVSFGFEPKDCTR